MKVKHLIEKLQKMDQEADAVIPVYFTHPTVGSRPAVNVVHVGKGIDWDNSRVMIEGDSVLVALDASQFEYFYSEFLKAAKIRSDAYKQGITDINVIEQGMNPLFKQGSNNANKNPRTN